MQLRFQYTHITEDKEHRKNKRAIRKIIIQIKVWKFVVISQGTNNPQPTRTAYVPMHVTQLISQYSDVTITFDSFTLNKYSHR